METTKRPKRRLARWLIVAALVLLCAAYFALPPVKGAVDRAAGVLASADVNAVAEYIRSFGPYAAVFSFALMTFSSVIAPLPAFLITLSNAAIFGWWQGAILSWSSAMVGAAVCFWIARILGRDAVVKLTSNKALKSVDDFFAKHGKNAILIARLLPFMSFDIVSYAAGLTSMGFWSFFIATGIGQLPATLVYSYVGGMLTGGAQMFVTALMILFALSALIVMIRKIYTDRQKKKGGNE